VSIHPTGQRKPESSDDHYSASDFLDEDGNFDGSKVWSITNSGVKPSPTVDGEMASEIRRRLWMGDTMRTVSEALDIALKTTRRHAHGEVGYRPGDEPEFPPVAYQGGEWHKVTEVDDE